MGLSTHIYLFALDLAIQWMLWAVATWFQTDKFYDLAGNSVVELSFIGSHVM